MNDALLRLYHRLPSPLRSVAASLRGAALRSWRYGSETERLVQEALEREHWSAEEWKSWQEERLSFVLHRAATRVPYYREQWSVRRRRGDRASWDYLENWPILTKAPLREHPQAFVADDCDPRRMYSDHTSGTTGTPLDLWFSRETVRLWYALFEARARHWNGVSRRDHWATLGGQPVVPAERECPPFWVWNAPMRQLYLSANHVSRRHAPAYLSALTRYRITHLVAYSSSVSALACEAIELGLPPSGLKVVITMAEPLLPWQRQTIRQGLGCEIRETYGMGELVAAASECSAGTLHVWPEVGWIEVLEDSNTTPIPSGGVGRLICTSLMNSDMPFIRYAVGDRSGFAVEGTVCRCGRKMPILSGIEGRSNDLLLTPDGRQVYWLNPIFYELPLREAQIIQERLDRVRIRYVPASGFAPQDERSIVERLQARMGRVEVVLERLDEVPRAANGKFQAVVCTLSQEERAAAIEGRANISTHH